MARAAYVRTMVLCLGDSSIASVSTRSSPHAALREQMLPVGLHGVGSAAHCDADQKILKLAEHRK